MNAQENLQNIHAAHRQMTRQEYESECARYGFTPVADADLGDYGDRFGCYGNTNARHVEEYASDRLYLHELQRQLRQGRFWALRTEPQVTEEIATQEEATPASATAPTFGSDGIRYDEDCDHCHTEAQEIDNRTGLCRRCHAWRYGVTHTPPTQMLINPATGSVDARENWLSEMAAWETTPEGMTPQQQLDTLVEVVRDENGFWVES